MNTIYLLSSDRHRDSVSYDWFAVDELRIKQMVYSYKKEYLCRLTDGVSSLFQDKTQEAKEIIDNYFKMIDQKEYDEDVLDEAIAFQNVGKQANRINCATIGWKAMREMIKESEDGKDE